MQDATVILGRVVVQTVSAIRLQRMSTGLFWDNDQYLELIKYTNQIVLPCSEKAMHAVAEELQRFGEKGELCYPRVF